MLNTFRLIGAALLAGSLAGPVPAQAAGAEASCPAVLQHTFPRLQDEKPQSLCQYSGKVLLVVNTASYCGFTSQYEGLEALHAKYAARGLVVLAKATGKAPAWNFHKYLIDRQGRPVASFVSEVAPTDASLVAAVEKALAQK